MYHYEYLNDTEFLKELNNEKIIEQYAKILILDWDQLHVIKEISGKAIGGSINVDATSAMRRTASIQLLVDEQDNNLISLNNLISINKKVDLQIGYKNFTNKYSQYPILWFPQGRFVVINANISCGKDGTNINLTLHDKMALLNGECGGVLPTSITFSEMEDEDNYGNVEITNPRISSIIRELMVHWGKQQEKNIIINDIEPYVKQVLRWVPEDNDKNLFYFYLKQTDPICKQYSGLNLIDNNASNNQSQFYEKLLKNLIKVGLSLPDNKILKKSSIYFPEADLIADYLLENPASIQINGLKKVIQNLDQVAENSNVLLNNYEKEASSLINLIEEIQKQIIPSPDNIISSLNALCTTTQNFYENTWRKLYSKNFSYSNTSKEERIAISKKLNNLSKIQRKYQKKQDINNFISQISTLKNKISHAKSQIEKVVSFKYYLTNESSKWDKSVENFTITAPMVLSWIFANSKVTTSNIKQIKNSTVLAKEWLSDNDKVFSFKDNEDSRRTFFIRSASHNNYKGYTKIGLYENFNKGRFFDSFVSTQKGNNLLYVNAIFSKEQEEIIKKYSNFSEQREQWRAIRNYNCIDELSDFIQKLNPNYALNIKKQFSIKMKKYFIEMCGASNKNINKTFVINLCNDFIDFCNYCLNELTIIKNDYEYNITTYKYIRAKSFQDKIINKKNWDELTQTYINEILNLVNKLPRKFNVEFTLPNCSYNYKISNLRDAGKYIVDNSGIFSDLTKEQRKKISNNNTKYIQLLYNNLKTNINNINFEEISFSNILSNIKTLIISNTTNIIKNIYIPFFKNVYKQNEPFILQSKRQILLNTLNKLNNRLKTIREQQLIIPQSCNQAYNKWCNENLSSYLQLYDKISIKNNVEKQLNNYKNNMSSITKQLNKTTNFSTDLLNKQKKQILQFNSENIKKPSSITIADWSSSIEKLSNIAQNLIDTKDVNFFEEYIQLLEKEIEETAADTAQQAIKEIKQNIIEKKDLLQTLIKKYEEEKIIFIKNFLQNTKNNQSKQQFYIAFAKAALRRDQNSIHLWKDKINKDVENMSMQDRKFIYVEYFGGSIPVKSTKQTELLNSINFDKFWENLYYKLIVPAFKNGIKTFSYGDDIGYTLTDFVFPGELICQPGDTITSVLDKIKNVLGNYEYFYNINGQFVFQEIKNYLNTSYSTFLSQSIDTNKLSQNYYNTLQFAKYDFSDENIIQFYQNNPQYGSIKNDFLVWGERKGINNEKIPIRYHLAIDAQPMTALYYFFDVPRTTIELYHYKTDLPIQPEKINTKKIFYIQQENSFYQWINKEDYSGYEKLNIITNNPKCLHFLYKSNFPKQGKEDYYYYDESTKLLYLYNTKTKKYERTYTYTIQSCIEQYNKEKIGIIGQYYYTKAKDTPDNNNRIYLCIDKYKYEDVTQKVGTLLTIDCIGTALFLEGVEAEKNGTTYNDYYTELKSEWPKIWDLWNNKMYKNVETNLSGIDYFLNILNSSYLVNQFGISKIGKRTKVISNNAINCIFEPTCPEIMFFDENPLIEQNQPSINIKTKQNDYLNLLKNKKKYLQEYNYSHLSNYNIINIDHILYKDIKIGGILRSAYEEIRSELYQYITYNEQVSLDLLPIYYLEANDIIKLFNSEININGNYIIKSFSLPLDTNNNMNITCSKVISRI